MRFYVYAAAALLSLIPITAHAQTDDGLKLPPPGASILNLSATETQKVPQDLLVASLRIEAEDKDASVVQSKINEAMKKALALAKQETTVKAETGSYSVYQYDSTPSPLSPNASPNQKPIRSWRGSQTIDLQSKDPDAALKLAGALQDLGFVMNNLGYTLSPEKYESVQDDLLTKALAKLTAKADLAAKTLKKSGYDMLNIDLNPSGMAMPMMARANMAMMEGAMAKHIAPPVAEAGDSDVSLTVSARALLKP